jgi:hypothetical protein
MSDRDWASTNAARGAIAALAVSALVALWTLVHAVRLEPVPRQAAPQFAGVGALSAPAPAPAVDVSAAVETDPFAADRSAPAHRYAAPGEEGDEAAAARAAPAEEPVVLGTALSDAEHSFATVRLGDDRSVILHAGDKIGEYTVKSIGRGGVVFTTPSGKQLSISALKP